MEQFILLAPLVAAIVAGFGWRVISERGAQILPRQRVALGALVVLLEVLEGVLRFGTEVVVGPEDEQPGP